MDVMTHCRLQQWLISLAAAESSLLIRPRVSGFPVVGVNICRNRIPISGNRFSAKFRVQAQSGCFIDIQKCGKRRDIRANTRWAYSLFSMKNADLFQVSETSARWLRERTKVFFNVKATRDMQKSNTLTQSSWLEETDA